MTHAEVHKPRIKDSSPLMAERAYEELFSYILKQGLAPGDKLTVDRLTRMLNISQTPVRQALTRLQVDGLVINQPNSGFRVAPLPSRKQLCDALAIRIAVEGAYIDDAVRNADTDTLKTMSATLDTMYRMIQANAVDYKDFFDADAQFHIALAEAGDNIVGRNIVNDLIRRSSVFRWTYQPHMPEDVYAEHKAIYDAVASGDAEAAKALLTTHLSISIGRVQDAGDRSVRE